MPMTATTWTISCDAYACGSPWSAKSKPLTLVGDRDQAIAAADEAGWRRCWFRNGAGQRKIMHPRNPAWWCPWHAQNVLAGEAERDRKDAELLAALDAALERRRAADPVG